MVKDLMAGSGRKQEGDCVLGSENIRSELEVIQAAISPLAFRNNEWRSRH